MRPIDLHPHFEPKGAAQACARPGSLRLAFSLSLLPPLGVRHEPVTPTFPRLYRAETHLNARIARPHRAQKCLTPQFARIYRVFAISTCKIARIHQYLTGGHPKKISVLPSLRRPDAPLTANLTSRTPPKSLISRSSDALTPYGRYTPPPILLVLVLPPRLFRVFRFPRFTLNLQPSALNCPEPHPRERDLGELGGAFLCPFEI